MKGVITFAHPFNDAANGEERYYLEVEDIEVIRDGVWCKYLGKKIFVSHHFVALIVFRDEEENNAA